MGIRDGCHFEQKEERQTLLLGSDRKIDQMYLTEVRRKTQKRND